MKAEEGLMAVLTKRLVLLGTMNLQRFRVERFMVPLELMTNSRSHDQ